MSKNEGVRLRMPNNSENSDEPRYPVKMGNTLIKVPIKSRKVKRTFREEEEPSNNVGVCLQTTSKNEGSDEFNKSE